MRRRAVRGTALQQLRCCLTLVELRQFVQRSIADTIGCINVCPAAFQRPHRGFIAFKSRIMERRPAKQVHCVTIRRDSHEVPHDLRMTLPSRKVQRSLLVINLRVDTAVRAASANARSASLTPSSAAQ